MFSTNLCECSKTHLVPEMGIAHKDFWLFCKVCLAWKVLDQYSSEASSFTRSERQIKSDPTMVICFEKRQNLSYGVDFNISKYLSFEEYKNGPLMSHVLKEGEFTVIILYSYQSFD